MAMDRGERMLPAKLVAWWSGRVEWCGISSVSERWVPAQQQNLPKSGRSHFFAHCLKIWGKGGGNQWMSGELGEHLIPAVKS